LEMLEAKTRGNLDRHEAALLKQTLMALRMAFVEAVEQPEPPAKPSTDPEIAKAKPADPTEAAPKQTQPAERTTPAAAEESPKKYSRKFSL